MKSDSLLRDDDECLAIDKLGYAVRQSCGNYDISLRNDCRFQGNVDMFSAGDIEISIITTNALAAEKKKEVNHIDNDNWFLIFQLSGTSGLKQFDNETRLTAGGTVLMDQRYPCRLDFAEDSSQLVVRLPVVDLPREMADSKSLIASRITMNSGYGLLLKKYLLSAHFDRQTDQLLSLEYSLKTLLKLVSINILEVDVVITIRERQTLRLNEIKQFVGRNIGSESLSLDSIADSNHVSRR